MPSWSICKLFSYPGIAILAFMWQAHNPCCWITNWYLKYLIYIFKNISTTLRLYWLHCGNTVNKKNNKPAIWNLGTYNGCMWGNDIQIGNFYSIICQGKLVAFRSNHSSPSLLLIHFFHLQLICTTETMEVHLLLHYPHCPQICRKRLNLE